MTTRAARLDWVRISLTLLGAGIAASFVWVVVAPIDLPWQHVDSTLTASATLEGRILTITGTTNLPDGAIVDYSFYREPYDPTIPDGGTAAVMAGTFEFAADVSEWTPGAATAYLSFSCNYGAEQPVAITGRVGRDCEHLSGDAVYVDSPGDPKQLLIHVEFVVPPNLSQQ
jgi:hypothetical protein